MSAPISSASTPKKFPQFPSLPPELRVIIWNFALPGSRVLKMKRRWLPIEYFYIPNALSGLGMLHTCTEARQVALKVFKVMPDPKKDLVHPLYFNAEIDTFHFGSVECFLEFMDSEKVEFMIIDSKYVEFTYSENADFMNSGNVERGIRRIAIDVNREIHGEHMVYDQIRLRDFTKYHADYQIEWNALIKAGELYKCMAALQDVRECTFVTPGSTVLDPNCEFMSRLVLLQSLGERFRLPTRERSRRVLHKEPESFVVRPVFTGISESEFQQRGETFHKYS